LAYEAFTAEDAENGRRGHREKPLRWEAGLEIPLQLQEELFKVATRQVGQSRCKDEGHHEKGKHLPEVPATIRPCGKLVSEGRIQQADWPKNNP
jgi:hypothetical protein